MLPIAARIQLELTTWVLLSETAGVGVVGVPVSAGDARGARKLTCACNFPIATSTLSAATTAVEAAVLSPVSTALRTAPAKSCHVLSPRQNSEAVPAAIDGSFPFSAVWVAVLTGLLASLVLSTLARPTDAFVAAGSVKKLMLQLMIPAVVAQVVNLLYNIVDRIYIGHIEGIGAAALTGVGLFTPILMLLNAFAMLVGAGGAPRTAIALGQGDRQQAEKIISNSFTVLMLFAVVLTIGFYAGAPALLRLFGASDATLPYALSYSRLYILGSVFVLLVLGMNPFITTQGFAKTSMLTTVIGAVINIILDPILIFGFGLGVQGAAIATVLSQAVGAAWILQFLTGKKTILRLRKDYLRPEKQVILPVLALGISTFVMLSTESLLSISFSSSLARYGGDVAVGAMTVITSASQLCTLPIQGVCQGGQPVMSFNFGAGKKPRVKEAFRFQLTLCGAYTCLFWLAMMLAPGAVAGIFTSDSALISYTTWAMRIYMAGIFAMGFQIACQQSFMALGQAKVSLLLACLRKIILLIPLIFILPHLVADPVFGVFLAEPVSDILAATITTITFFARFDKILDQGAARV